jgi:hypothetical protein
MSDKVHYQMLLPHERQILVGKIVDMLVYQPEFCAEMIERVRLAEEIGAIKSKFFIETQAEQLTETSY